MKRAIVLKGTDNVATVLDDIVKGDEIKLLNENNENCGIIAAKDDIGRGHKAAIIDIKAGESIIKYGHIIGSANENINIGAFVHVHNIGSNRGRGDLI